MCVIISWKRDEIYNVVGWNDYEAEQRKAQEFMKSYDDYVVRKNEEKAEQEIAKAKAEAEEHIERTVRHSNNLKTEDEQEKDNALKDMLKGLLG